MKIQLPALPYSLDALEPVISKQTLEHHYLKHHQTYVTKLNELIKATSYADMSLEEIIFESFENKNEIEDKKIFNNAAQVWNHTFYWSSMTPNREKASKKIEDLIAKNFGSIDEFHKKFSEAGKNLFGSGWIWLVKEEDGSLAIVPKENAGTPLTDGQTPLLVCDVWEHAYYLDQQEKRADYLDEFKNITNWSFVEKNLSPGVAAQNINSTKTENITQVRH
jgi:Fe-Mn family superoxide dismutase